MPIHPSYDEHWFLWEWQPVHAQSMAWARQRLLQAASGEVPVLMSALTLLTGYADPGTGHFRAAVESADKLHRHRSPTDHLELRQQMSATQVQHFPITCH